MKIAMISFWTCPLERVGVLAGGGMNIYILNLALELGKLGQQVDIFTHTHKSNHEKIQHYKNIRIIHLAKSEKIEKYIKTNNLIYDIIHAHYFYSGIAGIDLKAKINIPLVTTFHSLGKMKELYAGIKDSDRVKLEKKVVNGSDGIVASTEIEKNDLMKHYDTDKEKISVIPPGVNHHLFKPMSKISSREKLKIPISQNIILFVGRIDPIKGISLLIEATAILTKRLSDFKDKYRLLLIGGEIESRIFWQNKEVKKIKRLIMEKGLECCVIFIGSKPHSQLPYYYSAADVIVAPSFYESFGLVTLEAMACGRAVLASKVGGLQYLIKDKLNGRLFKSGDKDKLAEILMHLLQNEEKRRELGQNANITSQRFCWDIQAGKIADYYRKIL